MGIIIEGKPLEEWYRSDEGLVDYDKCEFRKNVSNHPDYVIYDLGEFEYDPDVKQTRYCNGVDLARVAGAIQYGEPYAGMRTVTAFNGDDYVRIFFHNHKDATIADFVLCFFHILAGDIYISETNHHVFVKGLLPTDETWKKAVEAFDKKRIHR